MRDEIKKVISELRGTAADQQLGQLAQWFDAYADDLQAILDADDAEPVEPEPVVTHADLCWLSRIFNSAVRVGPGWGRSCEVNDWLKAQIAARKPARIEGASDE